MTTNYYSELMAGWPSDYPYKWPFPSYGLQLQMSKAEIMRTAHACGIRPARCNLFLCMGMIETQHLSVYERDMGKDWQTNGSKNLSQFNLNEYMVRQLGCTVDASVLNSPGSTSIILPVMDLGVSYYGLKGFLDFVRGGYTSWKDGTSYGADYYRRAVAQAVKLMDLHPSLQGDDRRIEMNVPHVSDGDATMDVPMKLL